MSPNNFPDGKPLPDSIMEIAGIFCGCSTIENTWGLIRAELERLSRSEFRDSDGLDSAIVDHLGLSDHGTSIRGGWLTDSGKEALAWFQENGDAGLDDAGPWVDSTGCYWGVF